MESVRGFVNIWAMTNRNANCRGGICRKNRSTALLTFSCNRHDLMSDVRVELNPASITEQLGRVIHLQALILKASSINILKSGEQINFL